MTHVLLPAIWLLVFIAGLPQLSETVYTPSLPDIAHSLQTSASMTEYTLSIYLFGFAIGTLFWGKLSDKLGRKPCVLAGLAIFILGCIGCYTSTNIEMLMLSRLIQAFGGSVGSVLSQAISRDAFHGAALGKAYSAVGSSLAFFPTIGPVIGGVLAEHFGWPSIFLFLILFALVLITLIVKNLPETHHADNRLPISILKVMRDLSRDKNAVGFGFIVAACNGVHFSYFAEGPFYLIKALNLSSSNYGFTFIAIGLSTMMGGMLSKKLQSHISSKTIMGYGLMVMGLFSVIWSVFAILHHVLGLSNYLMIAMTILGQMGMGFGVCMTTSNALALALVDYKQCVGTASSLFGFFYYCLISLFTLGMGYMHNGTLLPMPLYFLGLSLFMIFVQKKMLRR